MEKLREKYLRKKNDAIDNGNRIFGFGRPTLEPARFTPVTLLGNITSLFALISSLLTFSIISFGIEKIAFGGMKSSRIMVMRVQVMYRNVLSTSTVGLRRIVKFDQCWQLLRIFMQKLQHFSEHINQFVS